jgi:hypothetical protein
LYSKIWLACQNDAQGVLQKLRPLQKAQVLTQRRKAAKILKKTFDLLCALAAWRLNLMFFQ